MPLVDMHDMLNHAYRNRYAVGSFGVPGCDLIEAIVAAAERCRSPVILSLADAETRPGDFELIALAAERVARRATVPVALALDHGRSFDAAVRAINLGCNGVMADAAHDSFPAYVAHTRRVVEMAHACGVAVEGRLGHDDDAGHAQDRSRQGPAASTSVEEARAYVERTRVDSLAITLAAGNGRARGRARLDVERLRRISEAVKIPLAIHGVTGLTDEQYRKLIQHGVARINCSDALARTAGERLPAGARGEYVSYVQGLREAIGAEVEQCLHRWGSAGRAAEVLVQCRSWQPVEHVILYNVEGADDMRIEAMMARGREVLVQIPGVRRVITGWAVTEKPEYRFCWLIEFASRAVVDSYRKHPVHMQFADQQFRPLAADRVSIDFEPVERESLVTAVARRASG